MSVSSTVRGALLAAGLLALLGAGPARAGRLMFGSDEKLHVLGEPFTVPGQGSFRLGHKVTLHFFLAGLYLSDDGYVLLPGGTTDKYLSLSDELRRELQGDGLLPDPLPPYQISWFDYLFGYSLWIVLAVVAVWELVEKRRAAA